MLHQFLHPLFGDDDGLLFGIVIRHGEPFGVRVLYHIRKVLFSEGPHDPEEELSFGKFIGELLLAREILGENVIAACIFVHVFDTDLLIVWHFEMNHLIDFEVELLFSQDLSHEIEGCPSNTWKKDSSCRNHQIKIKKITLLGQIAIDVFLGSESLY